MPATTTGAGRVWHPAIDAVGLVDPAGGQFQPHGLRKMAITVWLDAGVPIEEAAAWCGHKNVTVMYKHYKARRAEAERAQISRVDAVLQRVTPSTGVGPRRTMVVGERD